ncbi:glycosyltransferase family 2 protein [Desulfococcaceae bacterium HSG9]|nr:glycosyltransferase family 2 protein [Desulfococcaceae bacterium HSG9]
MPQKVNKQYTASVPPVSVVIAARNEETHIGARIENLLSQDYPSTMMEIIIVSDGSSDNTDTIINTFIQKSNTANLDSTHIKLIRAEIHKGKPSALNTGVSQASGEIIVFTDARQIFKPDAINQLVANFNDPRIGCVSGELVFFENSTSEIKSEMNFYWKLEKRIRKMEGAINSVAGATGAIYAIRKPLFVPLPEEILLDDVFIPMKVVFQGYRTIFDNDAVAYDTFAKTLAHEKKRKVRTLVGNYQLLRLMPELLAPFKNPIFFRYLSHKILRLFIPFFFIIFLFSSFLAGGLFYKLLFIASILTLLLPLTGERISAMPFLGKLSQLAGAFVSLNYFALLAFFYFIKPGKKNLW